MRYDNDEDDDLYDEYYICSICNIKIWMHDKDYHLLTHATTNYWHCPICLKIVYYYEHSQHMLYHNKLYCCTII